MGIGFEKTVQIWGEKGLRGGRGLWFTREWVGGIVAVGVGPCGQRWTLGWVWGMEWEWHDGMARWDGCLARRWE